VTAGPVAGTTGPEPVALRTRTGAALIAATVFASLVGFLDAYMVDGGQQLVP
jgi:hypothetical protein